MGIRMKTISYWDARDTIHQLGCHNGSMTWSLDKMVASFKKL